MQEYNKALNRLFERIGESSKMVLATSVDQIVSARTVSVLVFNGNFYFQTDRFMEKAKEIVANPNVALCFNEVEIKGLCHDIGNPNRNENKFFIERYKECFPSAYAKYTHLSNETIFEVKPILAKIWRYVDGYQRIEYIDFLKKDYRYEHYQV